MFHRDYFDRLNSSLSGSFAPQRLFRPIGFIPSLLFCSTEIISTDRIHPITGRPSLKLSFTRSDCFPHHSPHQLSGSRYCPHSPPPIDSGQITVSKKRSILIFNVVIRSVSQKAAKAGAKCPRSGSYCPKNFFDVPAYLPPASVPIVLPVFLHALLTRTSLPYSVRSPSYP